MCTVSKTLGCVCDAPKPKRSAPPAMVASLQLPRTTSITPPPPPLPPPRRVRPTSEAITQCDSGGSRGLPQQRVWVCRVEAANISRGNARQRSACCRITVVQASAAAAAIARRHLSNANAVNAQQRWPRPWRPLGGQWTQSAPCAQARTRAATAASSVDAAAAAAAHTARATEAASASGGAAAARQHAPGWVAENVGALRGASRPRRLWAHMQGATHCLVQVCVAC